MSRIKIAIVDSNHNYLNRLVNTLNIKYQNKMDIYTFSINESFDEIIKNETLNVLLVDESIMGKFNLALQNCSIGILTESDDVSLINGTKAISRYQNVELIYKFIIDLVSEQNTGELKMGYIQTINTKLVSFLSGGSGAGASTVSAALCYSLAQKGKKVLFLNLDPFATPNIFFSSEGNHCLSDLIASIKGKRGNFQLKLEGSLKCDDGVFFIDETTTPLDLFELNPNELSALINEICTSNRFDFIVIDWNLYTNLMIQTILIHAHRIILVSKGNVTSNFKTSKLLQLLYTISKRENIDINSRVHILFNQFASDQTGKLDIEEEQNVLGKIPRFKCQSSKELAQYLSVTDEIKSLADCNFQERFYG